MKVSVRKHHDMTTNAFTSLQYLSLASTPQSSLTQMTTEASVMATEQMLQ